jgi:acid phosphatase type 7
MPVSVWAAALSLTLSGEAPSSLLSPQQTLLQVAGDPSSEISVAWRAAMGNGSHKFELRPASGGEILAFPATTVSLRQGPVVLGELHQARAKGLKPGATYRWRVVSSGLASAWGITTLASRAQEPFEFLVMGDSQSLIRGVSGPLFAVAAEKSPEARFVLHVGDMVDDNLSVKEWQDWAYASQPLSRRTPAVVVPGNHEYGGYGRAVYRDLSPWYTGYFASLGSGSPSAPNTTWWFDFQGVRVIGLDTMKPLKEQVEWMESLPTSPSTNWTVVVHHHPVFPSMKGQEAPGRTKLLSEAFHRLGVDLVFTGHLHSYARSGLLGLSGERTQEGGTVYLISNSGGKHYRQDKMPWMQSAIPRLTSYARVRVDPDSLSLESIDRDGKVRDLFILRGGGQKPTRLEEGPASVGS